MNRVLILLRARLPLALGTLMGVLCSNGFAAAPGFDAIIITSASKQFVVRGKPQRSMLAAAAREDFAYLDPATLAVTCDRVKQALARELGWGDRWRATIYVNIRPVRRDNDAPDIFPFRTERGWNYRIDLPDEISRRQLLETIVETLVLEFADRASINESVELPPWLVEGLTAHLAQGPLAGMVLQARSLQQHSTDAQLRAPRDSRHIDVDQALRARVQNVGALTVDQLNWPEFEESDAAAVAAYHHASHLFVRELLRLPGGPDALCATLAMLPDHWNWQTAFLRGFEARFTRMLDVEKWWSLALAELQANDASVFWTGAEARRQFDEILYTPMEVRLAPGEPAHVTPVALQTVLNDWELSQQMPLLQTKLDQLQLARVHCTPELGAVADGYRAVIENYLAARAKPARMFAERKARAAINQAITELNALDQRRARLADHRPLTRLESQLSDAMPSPRAGAKPRSAWSEPRPGVVNLPVIAP